MWSRSLGRQTLPVDVVCGLEQAMRMLAAAMRVLGGSKERPWDYYRGCKSPWGSENVNWWRESVQFTCSCEAKKEPVEAIRVPKRCRENANRWDESAIWSWEVLNHFKFFVGFWRLTSYSTIASSLQNQCCGSAERWCGSRFDLLPWCRSGRGCGSGFRFFLCGSGCRSGSDFSPWADSDPDPDPRVKKFQTLEKVLKQAHIPYILAWHLQIDADPDPAYKFWCESGFLFDADANPGADPGYQNENDTHPCGWGSGSTTLFKVKVSANSCCVASNGAIIL